MIAQSIEFDLTVRLRDENFCPFTEMINKFPHEDTLLKDLKLQEVVEVANENIEKEMKRINDFKKNEANYQDKKDLLVKLPEEVFQLEQVYQMALDKVIGPYADTGSLSAFEYVNMCLYYDSESYPRHFAML